jgi:hypothetical protein
MPAAAATANGRHDLAGCATFTASGEVDDRAEDVSVAQEHVAARDASAHGRDDRVVCEGRGQVQGDRAGGGLVAGGAIRSRLGLLC